MRVAIVGGGIAGLGAAWCMHRTHELVLYEREAECGGHAHAAPLPATFDLRRADMGFLVFQEWLYPNLAALFDTLGLETEPAPLQKVSVTFDGGAWKVGARTPFWDSIEREVNRFQLALPDVVADPVSYAELSIADYVQQQGYSSDFIHKCLVPAASERFVTPRGTLSLSMLDLAAGFGPVGLYSMLAPTYWRTLTGGTGPYLERLRAPYGDHIRTGTPVERVARDAKGVTVYDGSGGVERFDAVVFAADAHLPLRVLDNPSAMERRLLGDVEYEPTRVVLHSDPAAMPKDQEMWASGTYQTTEAKAPFRSGFFTYYLPQTQAFVREDLFVALSPPAGLIDERKVHAVKHWRHLVADTLQMLRASEMHRLQGQQHTWYCGEYTGLFNGHEASLVSGLSVAVALGAPYPFEHRPAARRLFYDWAVDHIRATEGPAPEATGTWWPPTVARVQRDLAGRIAMRQVREVVGRYLPAAVVEGPLRLLERPGGALASRYLPLYELAKRAQPRP